MSIQCSCGVEDCRELGWPHEWDPIAAGDECMLGHGPGSSGLRAFHFGEPDPAYVVYDPGDFDGSLIDRRHSIRVPFVRWGSGYACAVCAEDETRS